MSNSLIDAFAQFGAIPKNRLRSRSAIANDGALVLGCSRPHFRHLGPGVLRYEDSLSSDGIDRLSAKLLQEHLILARDENLPVRMIVIAESAQGRPRHRVFARPDVVGRLVEFDGDRFIVDFERHIDEVKPAEGNRKRRS